MGDIVMATTAVKLGGDRGARTYLNALNRQQPIVTKALRNHQEGLDTLRGNLSDILSYLNGLISAGAISLPVTQYETLVDATTTTITAPAPSIEGSQRIVMIIQPATGFGQILWDTMFRGAPTGIDITSDTLNIFNFQALIDPQDGVLRWFNVSVPSLGIAVTP